jgi:hypothetical protein
MGRNALLQPFLSSSIWNIPIGTGAAYGLPQPKAGQASLYPVTIASMTADVSPVCMDPSQPLVTWNTNAGFSATNRCTSTGGSFGSFPCSPTFIIPSAKHNYSTSAIGANGSTYLQGGSFARCSGTSGPMNPTLENSAFSTETVFGDGLKGAKGGSKMSCLGGVIRVGELVPGGAINHTIGMNIDMLANGYSHSGINGFTFPATKADGYSYDTGDGGQGPNITNPFLCAGALLAVRPADLAAMTFATGTSGPGKILATALCHYGGYLTNDTKRSVRALCTEVSIAGDVAGTINAPGEFQTKWGYAFAPGGVSSTPWTIDCDMIFSKLYVVTNNTQGQYNTNVLNYNTGNPANYTGAGGGAPLVPFSAAPGSGNSDTPVWSNVAISSEIFTPASTSQNPHYNPLLTFAAVTSEVFNVTASSPTHIGPTIACGTASLTATTPMRA